MNLNTASMSFLILIGGVVDIACSFLRIDWEIGGNERWAGGETVVEPEDGTSSEEETLSGWPEGDFSDLRDIVGEDPSSSEPGGVVSGVFGASSLSFFFVLGFGSSSLIVTFNKSLERKNNRRHQRTFFGFFCFIERLGEETVLDVLPSSGDLISVLLSFKKDEISMNIHLSDCDAL